MKWESFKSGECVSLPLGDIHTLHPVVPTAQVLYCLTNAIPDSPQTAMIDMLYFTGDLTERLGSFNSSDVHLLIAYVRHVLNMAKKYNIKVRVLEGTPSHDWKQNLIFKTLNDPDPTTGEPGIGADLKYVDSVHIEYVEDHEMHVLYIPDLRVDAVDIWKTVLQKMQELDIDMVDYTCVHGAFLHQLPPAAISPYTHDPDKYCDITRYHIFANHIHIPSVYRNLLAGGSIECLRHGEEHPKGHIRSYVSEQRASHEFIVNPHKTQFKTIDLSGKTARECLRAIDGALEYRDRLACIRIIADKADEVYQIGDKLASIFPTVKFSYDNPKRKKSNALSPEAHGELIALSEVTLTKENLKSELLDYVNDTDPALHGRGSIILDEVIGIGIKETS